MRAKSDKEEARQLYGKGWMVQNNFKNTAKFQAYAQNGTDWRNRFFVGNRNSLEEAAELAMGEAFRRGWLNWALSVRWLKLRGVEIIYEEMLSAARTKRRPA